MAHEVLIVGVNHHTAPVEVRERLALGDSGTFEQFLRELVEIPGVHEAVALSTCNRVEVVTCCDGGPGLANELGMRLLRRGGIDPGEGRNYLFELRGREAVRHVFRVASSLDSLVVGEPQILGQMKAQFAKSAAAHAAGPILHRVFHKGFSVAKRVRTETGVASRAVSVASVAVDLASKIFESLDNRTVMLIGAGEIGEAAARSFMSAGAVSVMVANRTFETAVELARAFNGTPIPLDRMRMYLPLADLVVGSAGGGQLLDRNDVRALMKERKNRPVFFIDLAVPRNFDPGINDVDNAYLYDIDDLDAVVSENLGERKREAIRGEAIVEQEVDRFWRWMEQLDAVPTIVELRDLAERIRREEVERTLPRLNGLSEHDREAIEAMTKAILNKLLHHPTAVLKEDRSSEEHVALLAALRELFRLGGER
ncbi:MAG: glutamyl-tRNA reductase [Candidatus Dadabacteria bacterium]|nr:MAG: glutamyl-tRNA reductase [Candidatus Dadabacteria bacterium]